MRYLRSNTATTITVGPFLDVTDGVTPETAITVTGIHITFIVDNAGTPTLAVDADATASGGNNDMAHVTNDDAGYYTLELTAANTNYVGGALLSLNVVSTACPVFHEYTILPAQVYDSLVAGSDLLDTNASQLGGTAQTGRDIGTSVLLSNGTGPGQVKLASGYLAITWADIGSPSSTVNLSGTTVSAVSGAVGSVSAGVTVSANNDKNGYSLTQTFPTNFSALAITAGGAVTSGSVSDKTGYSLIVDYDAAKTAATQASVDALPSAATIAAAVWASTIAGTTTAIQAMRGFCAAMVGKASGLNTNTPKYRDIADTKDVISATTDQYGNRSTVTLDLDP